MRSAHGSAMIRAGVGGVNLTGRLAAKRMAREGRLKYDGGAMGMGRRNPVRVGSLLTSAVPALAERMLEQTIRRQWADIVGPDAARRSRPASLRQGTLEITVDNSPWLQELTLRAGTIAAALAARHGAAVTAVRVTMGAAVAPASDEVSREGRAISRSLTDAERGIVEATARPIADPVVASSLRRLLTKDLLARGKSGIPVASEQP
ncbi:MAG: hypothetical protein DME16_08385 [Candidatus Rokuibacteriota bacterium]|nr:MAG: hypothetical protein DME16_08385 [Candidatus Rokubacteria bacterium]